MHCPLSVAWGGFVIPSFFHHEGVPSFCSSRELHTRYRLSLSNCRCWRCLVPQEVVGPIDPLAHLCVVPKPRRILDIEPARAVITASTFSRLKPRLCRAWSWRRGIRPSTLRPGR